MRAVTIGEKDGTTRLNSSMPIPRPGKGQVLVKIQYAAQNPPDSFVLDKEKSADYRDQSHILGEDFLGIVVDGDEESLQFIPRDAKVFGWVLGNTSKNGAYAEYVVCDIEMLVRVPESVDEKKLVALPFSFSTALHALESSLGLDVPPNVKHGNLPVLVWGAGTACGIYASQLLSNAGYELIAVSGSDSHELLLSCGVKNIFSRGQGGETSNTIRSKWPKLQHILDCFASKESIEACISCLGKNGGHIHALMPKDAQIKEPENTRITFDLVHCMYGQKVPILKMVNPFPSDEKFRADRQLAERWFSYDRGYLYQMLMENRLKLLPITLWGHDGQAGGRNGFEGIQEAINLDFAGRLPRGKIVHAISNT